MLKGAKHNVVRERSVPGSGGDANKHLVHAAYNVWRDVW